MSALEQFRFWPQDHDPLAPREVATYAVNARRLIVVLRSDDKTDRYSLHRFPDGNVSWRCDTFTAPQHHAEPGQWIGYGGELSVGQVIERFPDHKRAVIAWTRHEIALGVDVADLRDLHAGERRARSLQHLSHELEAAVAQDRAA